MDIEGVSDFIALAESRSFSKAAAARFVTQPAFSRRIKALEEKMGAALVDRSVTPVALTKAGEKFLAYAKTIAETMDKAQEDVKSQIIALDNPVRIAAPHALAVTFFPQWYRNLQRSTKGLAMRVSTESASKCVLDLHKGLADLALVLIADGVTPCFDFDGISSRVVGRDMLLAVRAPHAKGNEHNFLGYPQGSYMASCAAAVIRKDAPVKTVFESPSAEILRAMALAGFGTAVLQESVIEDDVKEGFLVPFSKKPVKLACKIMLLRLSRKPPAKAEAIWDSAKA